QHLTDTEPLPKPAEQQRTTDTQSRDPACVDIRQEHAVLGKPSERAGQAFELATGFEHVHAAPRQDGSLADLVARANPLDQVDVAVTASSLFNNVHGRTAPHNSARVNTNPRTPRKYFHNIPFSRRN